MLKEKEFKSMTALKNDVRDKSFQTLLELLTMKFGVDRVSIVGNSEIAVGFDDVETEDGFTQEICFTVKPVIKDYKDRKTATKTIDKYDRLDEVEAYEVKKTEAEKKAEEKVKAKAEKIARDKKARAEKAKAKAEAEAKKAES